MGSTTLLLLVIATALASISRTAVVARVAGCAASAIGVVAMLHK